MRGDSARFTLLALALLALWAAACWCCGQPYSLAGGAAANARRIISLAPSITETLYALGLGEHIVGVTRFCLPPPGAAPALIGGFSEAWYEPIALLRPTLAVLPTDKARIRDDLTRLGLPLVSVETRSLAGLLRGIHALGEATHARHAAHLLERDITARLARARRHAAAHAHGAPPRVLICVMQEGEGHGGLHHVTAIGREDFYNALLRIAGGVNAYAGGLPYPRLSPEALLRLDPDVIIHLTHDATTAAASAAAWASLKGLRAVRTGAVHILADRTCTIPGPGATRMVDVFSRLLFPAGRCLTAGVAGRLP